MRQLLSGKNRMRLFSALLSVFIALSCIDSTAYAAMNGDIAAVNTEFANNEADISNGNQTPSDPWDVSGGDEKDISGGNAGDISGGNPGDISGGNLPQDPNDEPGMEITDTTLEAENSLGRLFADVMTDAEINERSANCGVYSVIMDGNYAHVSIQTCEDALLVVGIYDETGVRLLHTGKTAVSAGDSSAKVSIAAKALPSYYTIKAYLVDKISLRPLSEVYISEDYTQKMQEFYATTIYDFTPEQVLNLDESVVNNFLVFSDDVKVILENSDSTQNIVTEADEENLIWKITNPSEEFLALEEGDVFSYYATDCVIISCCTSLTLETKNDTPVLTIQGVDPDFSEIVTFIKYGAENFVPDASTAQYSAENAVLDGASLQANDPDTKYYPGQPWTASDYTYEFGDGKGKVQLSDIGGDASVAIFYDTKKKISRIELNISYGATLKLEMQYFEHKPDEDDLVIFNKPIPLGTTGLNLRLKASLVLSVEGKTSLEGKLHGSIGLAIDINGKVTNISKDPELALTYGNELEAKAGIAFQIDLEFLHEDLASFGVETEAGIKFTASQNTQLLNSLGQKHLCTTCLSISLKPYLEVKGYAKILFIKGELSIYDTDSFGNISPIEAYLSFDYAPHFGWGPCPHTLFAGNIRVIDTAGNLIEGATVICSTGQAATDEKGSVNLTPNIGKQNFYILKDGKMYTVEKNLPDDLDKVTNELTLTINLDGYKKLSDSAYVTQVYVDSYSPSLYHYATSYAALTKDGSLYVWGANDHGHLGTGDTAFVQKPTKILDNVKSFQFADSYLGSALTKDGTLYLWGTDSSGRIGNGEIGNTLYEPYRVSFPQENTKVREFYFSDSKQTCAALTEDKQLYLWGNNQYDQITSGAEEYIPTPTLVMEDVKTFTTFQNTPDWAA